MKYMASLRHLYSEDCTSLEFMPPDLGKLSSLQILTYFVAGASSGCSSIGELQNLDLGGKLVLRCLENVTEAQAKSATLGRKEKLRHLCLEWSSECNEEPVRDDHKKVLEALKPHDGLEMLKIVRYKSTCLPAWMKDLSLLQKHLTELHLVGFTMCEEFPQFSHFEALQILRLEELDKLQSLCNDEASSTFLKLKKLELCNSLKFTWEEAESKSVHVEQLDDTSTPLKDCPSTSVPKQSAARANHRLPRLESIYIDSCDSLVTLPHLPPALKGLSIWNCPNLCSVSGQLDALENLSIHGCNQLRSLDSLGHLPLLVRLDLRWCAGLTSLPGVLGSYSALRELTVECCPAIDMKPLYKYHQQRLDSLEKRDLSRAHSSDEGLTPDGISEDVDGNRSTSYGGAPDDVFGLLDSKDPTSRSSLLKTLYYLEAYLKFH